MAGEVQPESEAVYYRGMWATGLLIVIVLAAGVGLLARRSRRHAMASAEAAFEMIVSRAEPSAGRYDPAMVKDLPEVARRYFDHAIVPGTALCTTVRLDMEGVFLLGDARRHQSYAMAARQVLAPPSAFVWLPDMHSGLLRITGSDGLVDGHAWTRFWINGLLPVVNRQDTPDLYRSALTRPAMEAIWAPACLLPQNGVRWEQTGPDTARLILPPGPLGIEPIDLTLAADGGVQTIVSSRWSDANPDRTFRLQPFGGTVEREATFGGYTIPSLLKVGNHYGTPDYLPFFQARVTKAEFLSG